MRASTWDDSRWSRLDSRRHGGNLTGTINDVASLAYKALQSAIALRLMWAFIFLVSMYDIWLVYVCRDVISDTEQNPVCLALIQYDPIGLTLFTTTKIAGTLVVIAVCQRLVRCSIAIGSQVTSGVAGFQSGLLMYLTL